MADDKLHPTPEEIGAPPHEPGTGNAPAQGEPGDVVVDFNKINELMGQRRAAARAQVEQGGEGEHSPGPEETPEHTGDEGSPALSDGNTPTKNEGDPAQKPDDQEQGEKPREGLDTEERKPKRGRPPKAKTGPEADKTGETGKPRKGRPPKDKGKTTGARDNETKCPKARPARSSLLLAAAPLHLSGLNLLPAQSRMQRSFT